MRTFIVTLPNTLYKENQVIYFKQYFTAQNFLYVVPKIQQIVKCDNTGFMPDFNLRKYSHGMKSISAQC